jgi:hypothetical protein
LRCLWVQSCYMCPHTTSTTILVLLYPLTMLPIGAIHRCILLYVSSYYCAICVLIPRRTCLAAFFSPSTLNVSLYYDIRVRTRYVSSYSYAMYVSSYSRDVLAANEPPLAYSYMPSCYICVLILLCYICVIVQPRCSRR